MTENQKKKLLDLFTAHTIGEIKSSPKYILDAMEIKEPEQLSSIEGYGGYYKMLDDIAEDVGKIVSTTSLEEQTKKSIQLLEDKVKTSNAIPRESN